MVDYRRSLLGEVPEEYLLNYLTSAAQAQPALQATSPPTSRAGSPAPTSRPEQLRNRSWWTGAEVFVVVDDYDLVATQQSSPVALLQPLLAQARDVGLHVVVARRSGGASRALYEPVIQSMRDLAMPGPAALRQPRRGPAARQPAALARPRPAAAGWSPATAAARSSRWPGPTSRSERRDEPLTATYVGQLLPGGTLHRAHDCASVDTSAQAP